MVLIKIIIFDSVVYIIISINLIKFLNLMKCFDKRKKAKHALLIESEFGSYAEQWKSHQHNFIYIVRITADYIVYINKKMNIDWETSKEYDQKSLENPDQGKEQSDCISLCMNLEQKPIEGMSSFSTISFKKIICEAIVNCFEGNCESAKKALSEAESYRIERVIEKSREWYLLFTILISTTLISIIYLINMINLSWQVETVQMVNSSGFAILGACLSIILRSGNLFHASYAGEKLHFVECLSKLLGGAITGLIIFFSIKSNLIFASIITVDNSHYLYPLFSLLAGASERFTPSIISNFEKFKSIAP